VTRDALLPGSPLAPQAMELCSEACRRCAALCEQLASDDPMMERCAEICRCCAAACLTPIRADCR
jgi:hypothetical protein